MIISQTEISIPNAQHVSVSDEALTVELEDGRTLSAPLGWYPRLAHAKPEERKRWRLIGQGAGFIGTTSTKTSVSRGFYLASAPVKASIRFSGGWRGVRGDVSCGASFRSRIG